ncbi:MAG: hypothetical protein ACO1NO_10115 [Burkholderiaceae bacterium]
MRKIIDKLFTLMVLFGLVSSAYVSYYLRPWRWLAFQRTKPEPPDNPYTRIPLPQSGNESSPEKTEKAVV